ncbi:uncharacterized protein BJ171DRAFT_18598 [Polychytrium aggregatum]|uniref:uncharacterized protein n=1 Tax=Polychytrium aggregatum TaxID=110093 RepID=UPI0022FDC57A|nr:uncharacterized protein BJ171DRAFT_18598 [Polychytrium aggregatum]KAI9206768.1 hypothetical protein BJ171DRAFT_18598 [Polychytrium aggregatum]
MASANRRPSAISSHTSPSLGGASADIFIKRALEQIGEAKESRKLAPLKDAIKEATAALDAPPPVDPAGGKAFLNTIFTPFQLACQSRQPNLVSIAIDCLAKLFSYDFWGKFETASPAKASAAGYESDDSSLKVEGTHSRTATGTKSSRNTSVDEERESSFDESSIVNTGVVVLVVDTICDCFSAGDQTDEKVQLQIVKALLAAVSSVDPASCIHGGLLLKAIRTTYNIFLISKSSSTQIVAQATLTQMVQAVFSRVPKEVKLAPPRILIQQPSTLSAIREDEVMNQSGHEVNQPSGISDTASLTRGASSVDSFSTIEDKDAATAAIHSLGKGSSIRTSHDILSSTGRDKNADRDPTVDEYIKDAYLVFRALSKLSMKPVPTPEGATDLKSHAMRSKLLALHLVSTILSSHLYVFFTPSPVLFNVSKSNSTSLLFIHAVKQYLCLALTRNAVNVVPQVFDVAMEIFGKVLVGLRSVLKQELSVIVTEIVLPIIEAKNTITFHQRVSLLKNLQATLSDPASDGGRVLVEIYLNYDCDVEAGMRENLWERTINSLSRVMTLHYSSDASGPSQAVSPTTGAPSLSSKGLPPAMTTAGMASLTKEQVKGLYSATGDYNELKRRGLELLVRGILKSLVRWCDAVRNTKDEIASSPKGVRKSEDSAVDNDTGSLGLVSEEEGKKSARRGIEDDPHAFETYKHRKQVLLEGIRRFNFKPKKGMQYLLDSGCIPSRTPKDIGNFLLHTEGLNKTMIGEFLGEGDEENIAIMHAFVDALDFTGLGFVDALRAFLQCFRLPGEAQKIDRFMLKFAERYLTGNPGSFSSADTPYVLAYSVIMLNTDMYNTQVKQKMTKGDFLKNNRGIDEGKDLPQAFLEGVFDEIAKQEIVLKDEKPSGGAAAAASPEDLQRYRNNKEAAQFALASESMVQKTEALFNQMLTNGTGTLEGSEIVSGATYITASQYEHVKGMFQIIWTAVLTGLSGPLQESEDLETIMLALEGFRYAIKISCLFDMELERKAFISTLSKFSLLANYNEIKPKNLEAIKSLIEIGNTEGNHLRDSWREVVLCVSLVEKLQSNQAGADDRSTGQARREAAQTRGGARGFIDEAAAEASSQGMTIMVDKIFTASVKLSGGAIVEFVRALCQVSWEEISATSDKEHPRMYCLQRLVEISYYNMKRIRVEWSNIWAILGEHFNQVGCHANSNVGFFALDKLRQLSMKFLELEELPNFKFQKDFLKPFDHIVGNNSDPSIKDMVLACLQQMVQAKAKSLKSGWKTMFSAFSRAGKEPHDKIVTLAFDIIKHIFKNHFESITSYGTFPDFVQCLVEFCKNRKLAKTSLHSIELLRQSIPRIQEIIKQSADVRRPSTAKPGDEPNTNTPLVAQKLSSAALLSVMSGVPASISEDDVNYKYWFPVLFGMYEVVMTCDLEVRTRGLTYLFETLKQNGAQFPKDFWEVIAKGVLFPIFDDLKLSRQEHTKFENKDDMSVWLSTTLIQALRSFIDLYTVFFDKLDFLMDGVLELLTICMTQENETLARIGSTCLHQLIENNVEKLTDEIWAKICNMFVYLFDVTTPRALFFDVGGPPIEPPKTIEPVYSGDEVPRKAETPTTPAYRPPPQKKDFQQIIVKCVLHLLVIRTLQEVLVSSNPPDAVYRSLSSLNLFTLMDCLERSYSFAQNFNSDMDLRMALYRMGFMKQLPNLLKQETTSVETYVAVLIKMYLDTNPERIATQSEIEKRLIPLAFGIICDYNALDPEAKKRNVQAWRPVVVTILNALIDFNDEQFQRHMKEFYPEIVNLLLQEVPTEVRLVLHSLLMRAGRTFRIFTEDQQGRKDSFRGSRSVIDDTDVDLNENMKIQTLGFEKGDSDNVPIEEATESDDLRNLQGEPSDDGPKDEQQTTDLPFEAQLELIEKRAGPDATTDTTESLTGADTVLETAETQLGLTLKNVETAALVDL